MLNDWLFPQENTSGPGEQGPVPESPDSPVLFPAMMDLLNHVQSLGPPVGAANLPAAIPQAFPPTGKAGQEADMMCILLK